MGSDVLRSLMPLGYLALEFKFSHPIPPAWIDMKSETDPQVVMSFMLSVHSYVAKDEKIRTTCSLLTDDSARVDKRWD